MNAVDVLKYGHSAVQQAVNDLPDSAWEKEGACGVWSVKDIIGHLTSFEYVLKEVLMTIIEGNMHSSTSSVATPHLNSFMESCAQFNLVEVEARKGQTAMEVLAEYSDTFAQVMSLLAQIPAEAYRQTGMLPWYGMEYSLDDFIVYTFYGHKREHCAQIAIFRDTL